tara:strand:+ start:33 stop:992 length:960 start_codon:yes stop_codon:yes gene_type:complete
MGKLSVVGGSGFLGQSFLNIYSKKNKDFEILDINEPENFKSQFKIFNVSKKEESSSLSGDIILNLAAEHRDDVKPVQKYYEVNVQGAKNLCSIANKKNIKTIIFTSTVAVYGFAEKNSDESAPINPFNHYGRSKAQAEEIYLDWFNEDPTSRRLIIIRPTAIFGKNNRGNIYNLFKQIESGLFTMIGSGKNIKSIAYVDNVSEFIDYSLNFTNGLHIFNYVDKPDMNMNELVSMTKKILKVKSTINLKIPYFLALVLGYVADFVGFILRKNIPISSIRVKKFCSDTQFETSVNSTQFEASYSLEEAINKTLEFEFSKQR